VNPSHARRTRETPQTKRWTLISCLRFVK
jgi:hypothetical protein